MATSSAVGDEVVAGGGALAAPVARLTERWGTLYAEEYPALARYAYRLTGDRQRRRARRARRLRAGRPLRRPQGPPAHSRAVPLGRCLRWTATWNGIAEDGYWARPAGYVVRIRVLGVMPYTDATGRQTQHGESSDWGHIELT